VLCRRTATECM